MSELSYVVEEIVLELFNQNINSGSFVLFNQKLLSSVKAGIYDNYMVGLKHDYPLYLNGVLDIEGDVSTGIIEVKILSISAGSVSCYDVASRLYSKILELDQYIRIMEIFERLNLSQYPEFFEFIQNFIFKNNATWNVESAILVLYGFYKDVRAHTASISKYTGFMEDLLM